MSTLTLLPLLTGWHEESGKLTIIGHVIEIVAYITLHMTMIWSQSIWSSISHVGSPTPFARPVANGPMAKHVTTIKITFKWTCILERGSFSLMTKFLLRCVHSIPIGSYHMSKIIKNEAPYLIHQGGKGVMTPPVNSATINSRRKWFSRCKLSSWFSTSMLLVDLLVLSFLTTITSHNICCKLV